MAERAFETPTLKQLSDLSGDKSSDELLLRFRRLNRRRVAIASIITFTSDSLGLSAALFVAVGLFGLIGPVEIDAMRHLTTLPLIIGIFFVIGMWRGFYPGYPVAVVAEFRQIFYANAALFATLAVGTFLFREHFNYSRAVFLLSWIFSAPFVLGGRALLRVLLGKMWFWGAPALVMGSGETGRYVINSLQSNSHLGIRATAVIDDNLESYGYYQGVPIIGGLKYMRKLAEGLGIKHLIVAVPGLPAETLRQIAHDYGDVFEHITFIHDKFGLSSLWVAPSNLGMIIGLDVQHQLLRRSSQIKKRMVDVTLSVFFGIIALPLIAVTALLVRLDSPGPVFFLHERIGRNNKRFYMIKFRSMHHDACGLRHLLDQSEELRAEYETYHKLLNDPRITRIGHFLRKYSLDELPQFWNILKGEMSLIGPRAYEPGDKMQGYDEIIFKVAPGLTGLWQVTERNDTFPTFMGRLHIDDYYICNWSMFMDAFIVARTFAVILFGKGK